MSSRSSWLQELERLYAPHPIPESLRAYLGAVAHASPSLSQVGFRGYADDAAEGSRTPKANENTGWTQAPDENFIVRFAVDETAGGSENNATFQLQYNLNGAGWNDVNAGSAVARAVDAANMTGGTQLGQALLTSGTGTRILGEACEDGLADSVRVSYAGGEVGEVEFAAQLVGADVVDSDSVQLRVIRSGGSLEAWTQTPTVTVSEADTEDDLGTPNGVTAGAPSLGAAALGQVHALAAVGVDAGPPTLASPAVGQVHNLTANAVAAGSPTLGTPALSEASGTDALTALDLTAGAPSLGTPALGQEHVLTASGLDAGAVTLGSPSVAQDHVLSGEALTTGAVQLGTPGLGQVHEIEAVGVTSGAPSLGSPVLGTDGTDALQAEDLETAAPILVQPAIGQAHVLEAVAITAGAPQLASPSIAIVMHLGAAAVTTGAPAGWHPCARAGARACRGRPRGRSPADGGTGPRARAFARGSFDRNRAG